MEKCLLSSRKLFLTSLWETIDYPDLGGNFLPFSFANAQPVITNRM